jgi:hypothetical protein
MRLDMGWKFFQEEIAKTRYTYSLQLYSQQSVALHPSINMPFFMFFDMTNTLDNFKIIGALEFVVHKVEKLFCMNVYVDIEQVWAKFKLTLKITECYAILISCFWNWENWTGPDAEFFDSCALSKDTDVTIYEYKNDPAPVYAFGAKKETTVTGASCYPGKNEFIPLWRPVLTTGKTMLYNVVEYFNLATS